MQGTLTGVLLSTSESMQGGISTFNMDANFVSIIFSLIGIFLGLIMGVATYLLSAAAPSIGDINDIEDQNTYDRLLTDLEFLAHTKESVHRWLFWIYLIVVALPIGLIFLFILGANLGFKWLLGISIFIYIYIFIYVAITICRIVEQNIILDSYQRKSLRKKFTNKLNHLGK